MSQLSTEALRAREQAVGEIYGKSPLQQQAAHFLREHLTQRPLATLGVAAVIGLILGRLVKR